MILDVYHNSHLIIFLWPVSTQTQPRVYKVCVLVDVIACSRTDIDHAFKDIMHLCDEVVKKQIFADTKQKYSKILAKLSNSQVGGVNSEISISRL